MWFGFLSPVEVLVNWFLPSARFVLGTALGLSQKTFDFPSPVGVLVSWLLPSAWFVFGDRLRSLAEGRLL